jgi:hypothetical protein
MTDLYIFAFGLVVTLIVGSGLVTMVVVNNRSADDESAPNDTQAAPAVARAQVGRDAAGQ